MASDFPNRPSGEHKTRANAAFENGLGQRGGICALGFPHPWDPFNCELDNLVQEDCTQASETHHEDKEKMRQHLHSAIPNKWELLRAHADPDHPARVHLEAGHGALLNPLTKVTGDSLQKRQAATLAAASAAAGGK